MMRENISKTEVKILRLFPNSQITISEIADLLKIKLPWASKCVSNLVELGFLERDKKGRETYISVADTPLGTVMANLLIEEAMLNLHALIGGTALRILPLLLHPGYSVKEMSQISNLTVKTIYSRLKRWQGMGVAIKSDGVYVLNPRIPLVIKFAEEYIRHKNRIHQKEHYPDATIIWEDRADYIISTADKTIVIEFKLAGPTKIGNLGYDIVSRNYYYYYSPTQKEVSEAEALVQTVKFNLINPRPLRYIKKAIKDKKVTKGELRKYAKKYGIEKRVEEALA